MFRVYWSAAWVDFGGEDKPYSRDFPQEQMPEALAFSEGLRKKRREGAPISFIIMSGENPNQVGEAGCATAGEDYNWRKRRGHGPNE